MPPIKLFAAAACAALLAGCASVPTAPAVTVAQPQSAAARDSFDAAGKLSAQYRKDGNPESITVNFRWTQKPGRIDVALSSPMATLATISITPESATLVQSDKVPRVAKDIDTLTAQTLGWSLPVSGLRDWLQGYATGADGKRFVATPANNSVTTNDGWRLRFVSWHDAGGARPQPKLINAERIGSASADDLAIRIFIDAKG
jgi:outer membrane lipoprotein LolB